MNLKERIQALCKKENLSMNQLEEELGFGKGYISKLGKSTPNAIKIQQIADRLNVTVDYLMNGEGQGTKTVSYTDISDILNSTRDQLMSQDGLMFDGEPASPEAIDSILSAMQVGMEMARQKNKEKYTPKKYRKG